MKNVIVFVPIIALVSVIMVGLWTTVGIFVLIGSILWILDKIIV